MNRQIEDHSAELLELGSATEATQGNDVYAIEGVGFMPKHGISHE